MNSLFNAVVLGALSVIFSAGLHAETHQHGEMSTAAQATPEQVIAGTGVVKAVDLSTKKITIAHDAIPAIGWPAMTMRFTFVQADETLLALKAGSHVNFTFVQQGNLSLLKSIK